MIKYKIKRRQQEHDEQVALFEWARMNEKRYPQLKFMFAIPNGGARHPATARKLKAEGVKAGVPDIFFPHIGEVNIKGQRGWSPGLFIEMKSGGNKLSPAQKLFEKHLQAEGYIFLTCHSWVEAKDALVKYLEK